MDIIKEVTIKASTPLPKKKRKCKQYSVSHKILVAKYAIDNSFHKASIRHETTRINVARWVKQYKSGTLSLDNVIAVSSRPSELVGAKQYAKDMQITWIALGRKQDTILAEAYNIEETRKGLKVMMDAYAGEQSHA